MYRHTIVWLVNDVYKSINFVHFQKTIASRIYPQDYFKEHNLLLLLLFILRLINPSQFEIGV